MEGGYPQALMLTKRTATKLEDELGGGRWEEEDVLVDTTISMSSLRGLYSTYTWLHSYRSVVQPSLQLDQLHLLAPAAVESKVKLISCLGRVQQRLLLYFSII